MYTLTITNEVSTDSRTVLTRKYKTDVGNCLYHKLILCTVSY